ncbi:SidA/IucD/PvdA family monooxygenase [Allofrancisella guangzhouensis]|nr:SidA/IucD/PvdA family monooxygenase [Allofrancisella guangzhouensis]MBK2045101.1 SidA/IucD/PvdA family monooxygenase [Allofrancisella guangzhouensis]
MDFLVIDKKERFCWHGESLLYHARSQTSFLKDLVTPIDPTHPLSFLSYLHNHGLLYVFLSRNITNVYRKEMENYYVWCCNKIREEKDNIRFSTEVIGLHDCGKYFRVDTSKEVFKAKNLVVGLGIEPIVIEELHSNKNVIHSSQYLDYKNRGLLNDKKISIVGGSQSGAEILNDIIDSNISKDVSLYSRRINMKALQETSFDNELYNPSFVRYFTDLPDARKDDLLKNEIYTSDGITQNLLDELYNKIYSLKFVDNIDIDVNIYCSHNLRSITEKGGSLELFFEDINLGVDTYVYSDIAILCIGYRNKAFDFLENIQYTRKHRKVFLDVSNNKKIYIQNGFRRTFGLGDSNLSLSAYRNSMIINDILGYDKYKVHHEKILSYSY